MMRVCVVRVIASSKDSAEIGSGAWLPVQWVSSRLFVASASTLLTWNAPPAPIAHSTTAPTSADSTSGNAVLEAFAVATNYDAASSAHVRGLDTEVVRLWDRSEGADWQDTKPDVMSLLGRVSVPLPGSEEDYERSKFLQFPMRYYRAPDEYGAPETPYKTPIIPR